MLCDLVCAKTGDAGAIAAASNPSDDFDAIDTKGIETIKLEKLHVILLGKKTSIDRVAGDDEGPWVFELPKDFVKAVAALDAAKTKKVAATWGAAEEFKGWKPAQVAKALQSMGTLARKATKGKTLFLWMSL